MKRRFYSNGKHRVINAGGGLEFCLTSGYQARDEAEAFELSYLEPATFNHDYSSWKTSGWADGGLKQYGPYDRETFPLLDVRILVISPEEHKGDVEKFIKQFENGILDGRNSVFSGFPRKYHLRSVAFDEHYIPTSTATIAQDYERGCVEAAGRGVECHLAFLVIRKAFENLPATKNPYYVGKAALLSQGIPVQEMHVETIRRQHGLEYVLNNIGLACHAKLGGTPYVLRAQEVVRKELVIGIGRTIDKETRLAQGKQYIGFTTVFKNNGDFLLSSCTPYCDFGEYEKHLGVMFQ